MPDFAYEALDKGGKQVKGVIEAQSEEVIIEKLRGMGFYPTKVTQHKKNAAEVDILALPILRNIFHRIKTKHVMTFTRQLATLIDAGLPILRSLGILEEQVESVVFKEKIRAVSKDIEAGSSLSDALSKHPRVLQGASGDVPGAPVLVHLLRAPDRRVRHRPAHSALLVRQDPGHGIDGE
jgi:type II secretory pathway component PulF